MKIGQVTGKLW